MDKEIRLYTDVNCPHCKKAIDLLYKNGVKFEIIYINNNMDEWLNILEKIGLDVTPVLKINDDFFLPGTHFQTLEELLDLTK